MTRKRIASERDQEKAEFGRKTFSLPVPKQIETRKELETKFEKTSLFVPSQQLFKADFVKSSFSDDVLITRNVPEVLKIVFQHGDVAKRYGDGGLEDDPTRQQIIIYTMVVCQKNLLWYQRAVSDTKRFIGEPRLQGRFTVGFGGHKTQQDLAIGRDELIFLRQLMPAIHENIGTILGLNKGLFSEVEEEIGIGRDLISDLKLLGAFYDKRIEDPTLPVQVGWVHTGIAAVLEVDPILTSQLTFRSSEIAKAWWVPYGKVGKELGLKMKDWFSGKGPRVESWTEIVLREFWQDYLLYVQ